MKLPLVFLAVAALFLSGCVTERRSLTLKIPSGQLPAPTKGSVYIAAVTDDREFQDDTSDPSIPSIDREVAAPAGQKERIIGRLRDGMGQAKGDVTLPENDSVRRRARLLVEEGLRRAGYAVTSEPEGAIPVTISVEQFWAWMSPGMLVINFDAKISCRVTLQTSTGNFAFVAWGFGKTHGEVARDTNWQEAYDPTFEDFLTSFKKEIDRIEIPIDR